MNKKEQAEMDALREQVAQARQETRVAKALRFTDEVTPDIAPPTTYSEGETSGYDFNAYTSTVQPACSGSTSHYTGAFTKPKGGTGSKGAVRLYSTRLLALRGLRHAVELECAKRLANIDTQIEKELAVQ